MNQQQQIIQAMLATPVKGFVAKRFFHVTAPERHAENILAKMEANEKFYSFILLPNSKKQTVEGLICTNRRLIIWQNEFAEDEEIPLVEIESMRLEKGWLSGTLHLVRNLADKTDPRKFKCETEIISAFHQALVMAKAQS